MATFGEALQQARQLLGAGKLAEARSIYQQLVTAVPQAAEAWHELGITHLQAGDGSAAVDCLRRAVTLDAASGTYHANLGAAYRLLKEPQRARECFERAVQIGPPTAELYNNLCCAGKTRVRAKPR